MPGRIVLFYPPYEGDPLGAPLCLLALAAKLREEGFEAVIVDAAVDTHFKQTVLEALQGALCLGISVLTGPMIRGAIAMAKLSKEFFPKLPVVFGGWHPTLLPDQTLAEPYVDVIVRGQGEITLCELARAFGVGGSLHTIAGISWKTGPIHTHNPDRAVEPLENLPLPAFDMMDFDAYEAAGGLRKLAYATSIGCPYACNYCTDMVFYKRRFNALSAERVVRELTDLVTRYRIEEVALLDSNFPVDLKRALAIARGILESGVKFRWTFQASTDFICRMSEDDLRLLGASGVTYMGFGTESTSPAVLRMMNKRHQRVDEMYETARRAAIGGIRVTFNLIFGYPGETEADRQITFRTMGEIARMYPNVRFSPNIFTPYPGIPIWPQLRELGVKEPASLRAWGELALGVNMLPWLQGKALARFERMLQYFLLHGQLSRRPQASAPVRKQVLSKVLAGPVAWRIRKNYYEVPWELQVSRLSEKLIHRRSLVTGRPLPAKELPANAC